MIQTQIGFKSSTGVLRTNNEDSCFVIPSHDVYVVADGVGGNNSGEIASQTAVRLIAEYVDRNPIEQCREPEEIYDYLEQCLIEANREIYTMGRENEENRGMATTAVVAYIRDNTAYLANIGDSRAYLFHRGKLTQITEDHTYVNELLKRGVITTKEAENHRQRNVITRALGAEPAIQVDYFQYAIEKGDILMLCSDGLYGEVKDPGIIAILQQEKTMSKISSELVDEAIRCGGRDNITVVCLKI